MSALTRRLSEDDVAWLARMNRAIDARWEALQREKAEQEDEAHPSTRDGEHDAA